MANTTESSCTTTCIPLVGAGAGAGGGPVFRRARDPELWSGLISGRGLGVRGSPVRASSVEKLASLQKARRKGGFFQGRPRRGETGGRALYALRRGRTKERWPTGVWGKRNEKVTGRGGKSSNVNTEHVAMRRKHPAPANLFTKGALKVRYVLAGGVKRNE